MPIPLPGAMSTPPLPVPPESPSLTAYAAGGGGAPAGPPQGGGLMRLFFEVEKSLDTIAAGAPGVAEGIDSIKQQLRTLLTSALQKGAAGNQATGFGGAPQITGGPEPI